MKIKNRQQFLVVLTIAAFALLIGVDFIYEPLSNWWTARSQQIIALRQQVADGKKMIQREAIIRGRWNGMRTNALPASPSLAEQQVLKALDAWSRDSGAEITSITPQWKNTSTNYLTLDCRVETAGTLDALSRFLYAVEKGQMALKIDSLELSAHDNTGQQLTLGLEINGLALTSEGKK